MRYMESPAAVQVRRRLVGALETELAVQLLLLAHLEFSSSLVSHELSHN